MEFRCGRSSPRRLVLKRKEKIRLLLRSLLSTCAALAAITDETTDHCWCWQIIRAAFGAAGRLFPPARTRGRPGASAMNRCGLACGGQTVRCARSGATSRTTGRVGGTVRGLTLEARHRIVLLGQKQNQNEANRTFRRRCSENSCPCAVLCSAAPPGHRRSLFLFLRSRLKARGLVPRLATNRTKV